MTNRIDSTISVSRDVAVIARQLAAFNSIGIREYVDKLIRDDLAKYPRPYADVVSKKVKAGKTADVRREPLTIGKKRPVSPEEDARRLAQEVDDFLENAAELKLNLG